MYHVRYLKSMGSGVANRTDGSPTVSDKPTSKRRVAVLCTPEYAGWLGRLADHGKQTLTGMIEAAAGEYARSTAFDEPAPRRVPRRRTEATN